MQKALIIPAFEPRTALLTTVNRVLEEFDEIIVVNDGSVQRESLDVLAAIKKLPKVRVLEHAANLGKGAALKTAFNFIYTERPNIGVMVTADADGQHAAADIQNVLQQISSSHADIVLGSRPFSGYVPLRSRIGNSLTRMVFRIVTGVALADTQTGLRGIRRSLIPKILTIKSDGYDFEFDMLLKAVHSGMNILQVPIQTIYEAGNASSHFNPFFDSMKIYFLLLRFTASSIFGAVLDCALFGLFYLSTGEISISQFTARALAAPVNFFVNRSLVFKSRRQFWIGFLAYAGLVAVNCTGAYFIINYLHTTAGLPILTAKISVEVILFFVSYSIQKELIFRK